MSAPFSLNLDSLATGSSARVTGLRGLPEALAERLLELGFEEGAEVEALHRAPLGGDPLAVRVDGAVVALRRTVARGISISAPLSSRP